MLEIAFWGLVGLVLIGPFFMNIVGPFIVWRTQRIPTIVQFELVSDDDFFERCTEGVPYFDEQMIDAGFVVVGNSSLHDSHTDTWFRVYWHAQLKLAGTVVGISATNQPDLTYCEFSQKFSDGRWLNVSNSNRPEAYPALPIKQSCQFPEVQVVEQLLSLHAQLRQRLKGGLQPVDYQAEQGFAEITAFLREESDALLDKGLVKPEIDADGKRSLTLYGAFVMTWRSVWPGRAIVAALKRRGAKRAVARG
ncbi:hypothetical protein [Halopseudomonas aestusnigri]|uniref:Uncharacterized protein n=1 Tax=Halopseudomonas aestusnigri TaxID=857252 RepID=A0AAQ1G6Q5_9GAMM|nr:hypothetical protein [Halopseudomonas aestusnigri]OWL89781.1 hypothetical protein B7O88_07135 [Halopseudomonas aestusnigri]SEG21371.1 hypothetical protein SAMN05216586_104122 [Halopseudomonas aestusnigri]